MSRRAYKTSPTKKKDGVKLTSTTRYNLKTTYGFYKGF